MFTFAIVLLCFQVCLVQNVLGQVGWCGDVYIRRPYDSAATAWAGSYGESLGPYGSAGLYGYGAYDRTGPYAGDFTVGPAESYGGAGVGEVNVAGELPAGGATAVTGQVPILGAVEFGGPVRAAGTIVISGTCGCGCPGPYIY